MGRSEFERVHSESLENRQGKTMAQRNISQSIGRTPSGMSRRHFMNHLAASSALTIPAMTFTRSLQVHAQELKKNRKAAILLWMGGGPSTIDLWDLKPGAPTGGEFSPIATSGDMQICEHLPMMAQQMHNMSIVRSMSTREADHERGRYYMQTGYIPSTSVKHPCYGSVIAHELMHQRQDLEIPPFVRVGGNGVGPGFLGMAWAPFVVNANGTIKNLYMGVDKQRMARRMETLRLIEQGFVQQNRGSAAKDHQQVLGKTFSLMTSQQMAAFKVDTEPQQVKDRYGDSNFGKGCLLARRLVQAGVPFVEVSMGGWDNHQGIFNTLRDQKMPQLDKAMSALIEDLDARGMLEDTVVMWMGEFGRTPRINGNGGRDHWARSWSAVVGGGGLNGGLAIGETNDDGTEVVGESHSSEDLMASVCRALGISLETTFTSRNGRPMKIANSGSVIPQLFS